MIIIPRNYTYFYYIVNTCNVLRNVKVICVYIHMQMSLCVYKLKINIIVYGIKILITANGINSFHIPTQRLTITRFKGISVIPQISIITRVPKPRFNSI